MIGIRQKLMLGFGGLLAVIAIVGALTMVQINGVLPAGVLNTRGRDVIR